ncbi:XPC-binding domain-containing protein, partial [Baffinella frigidus]
MAQLQAQMGQMPGGGGEGAGGPLDHLRVDPQFNMLRQLVQARPEMLQPLLAELGQAHPEVLQQIQDNQEEFVPLINQPEFVRLINEPEFVRLINEPALMAQGGMGGEGGEEDSQNSGQ